MSEYMDYIAGYIAGVLFSGRTHLPNLEPCQRWLIKWAGERAPNFEKWWEAAEGAAFRRLLEDNAYRLDDFVESRSGESIEPEDLEALETFLREQENN